MSTLKKLILVAAAEAFLILRFAPDVSPSQSTFGLAAILWFAQAFVWATYKTIIYPYYLSPLKDIPGPKVSKTDHASLTTRYVANLYTGWTLAHGTVVQLASSSIW